MSRWSTIGLAFFLSATAAVVIAAERSPNATKGELKIGDKAPTWSELPGTDGKTHSLDDYQSAKALVVVFTCNHCPVAQSYEDRIIALQKNYRDRGLQIVAINVNNLPPDRLDKMKIRAEEKGFTYPYLYDESQQSAKAYGAKVTPHFFLFDKDRQLVYRGALDNNMNAAEANEHYLQAAIDAVLTGGKKVEKTTTKAIGCAIKYDS